MDQYLSSKLTLFLAAHGGLPGNWIASTEGERGDAGAIEALSASVAGLSQLVMAASVDHSLGVWREWRQQC